MSTKKVDRFYLKTLPTSGVRGRGRFFMETVELGRDFMRFGREGHSAGDGKGKGEDRKDNGNTKANNLIN